MIVVGLCVEADNFKLIKQQESDTARQTAAFFIACGIDLAAALSTDGEARKRICQRLRRLIERERLRGMRRHWSYDLNRHIALKQALTLLLPPVCRTGSSAQKKKQTKSLNTFSLQLAECREISY